MEAIGWQPGLNVDLPIGLPGQGLLSVLVPDHSRTDFRRIQLTEV